MDIPSEHVRPEIRTSADDQVEATTAMRGLVERASVGEDPRFAPRFKAELVLGGFGRRRFLSAGGAGLASAALLAAWRGDGGDGGEGGANEQDVVILRTASSLERLAVAVYETGLGSGLLTEPSLVETAQLFADHHREHSEMFEGATISLGGVPFTQANPAVLARLQARIDGLNSQKALVQLAHEVETLVAATYFSSVGSFVDSALDRATMSVAGVEARHVTILSTVLVLAFATPTDQYPARGFQTGDKAVLAGVGVS